MPGPTVTTAEHLLTLREPGFRHELLRGELRRMSPAGHWHGAVVAAITRHLANHVADRRSGQVYGAETGFMLARNPDTVRAPDVSFVRQERVPREGPGFFLGPPDLAIEVTSPGDSWLEVREKALSWITYGTRLVWVVDPIARHTTVYRSCSEIRVLTGDDLLTGGDVLPGFSIAVRDLFQL